MFLSLLQFFATKFLFLALHLEAGSFPRPLSPQEEIRTFAALRTGDSSAREKLIRHNLRLVAHIAKKYYALPSEQDDLISIGTIGLMKAVDTFDSTRRARFSTYASRCIENELRMHFRRERKNAPTLSLQETLDAGKEFFLTAGHATLAKRIRLCVMSLARFLPIPDKPFKKSMISVSFVSSTISGCGNLRAILQ